MSDIEKEVFRQIGIDLINEYRQQDGLSPIHFLPITTPKVRAFIRSIQLHEKTKQELADCKQELSDFRQEVSDAVEQADLLDIYGKAGAYLILQRFIIPAPKLDPLVRVINEVIYAQPHGDIDEVRMADDFRAALDARGLEIREKNDD